MDHGLYAAELFLGGYNCAQSIVVAFHKELGLTPQYAAKMASSFGGGMGRMREVCGAVSGMLMVAGLLYGYDTPGDDVSKKAHYTLVQELSAQFRNEVGSIVCREILKNPPSDPNPTPRPATFWFAREAPTSIPASMLASARMTPCSPWLTVPSSSSARVRIAVSAPFTLSSKRE